jgi:hypothetical protein
VSSGSKVAAAAIQRVIPFFQRTCWSAESGFGVAAFKGKQLDSFLWINGTGFGEMVIKNFECVQEGMQYGTCYPDRQAVSFLLGTADDLQHGTETIFRRSDFDSPRENQGSCSTMDVNHLQTSAEREGPEF